MANKLKEGLDYFSFDVDFFQDDKIELISAEFGLKGEIIAIRLLCQIYRNGYFYKWGKDESLLFAKRVGNGVTGSFVDEVVMGLVKRSFFDEGVFNSFQILTSKGIQKRFVEGAKRRQEIHLESSYMLVDPSEFKNVNIIVDNVRINSINVNINSQRKGKEVKEGKERKCVKVLDYVSLTPTEIEKLKNDYGEEGYEWIINKLNYYKGSKGAKYKNDYMAIGQWVVKSYQEEKEKSCGKKEKVSARQAMQEAIIEVYGNG